MPLPSGRSLRAPSGRTCPFCSERHAALLTLGMITKDLPLISGKSFVKGKSFAIMAPAADAQDPQRTHRTRSGRTGPAADAQDPQASCGP